MKIDKASVRRSTEKEHHPMKGFKEVFNTRRRLVLGNTSSSRKEIGTSPIRELHEFTKHSVELETKGYLCPEKFGGSEWDRTSKFGFVGTSGRKWSTVTMTSVG